VVEDAAGNRATIYGPVPKTIVAPPTDRGAANGTPASDQARFTGRRHRTVTTSFRHRRLRVRGRVVRPDRKPIAGATIEVLAQLHRVGPGFRPMGSLPTSRMAGFSFKAPPGASRPALRLPLHPQRRPAHLRVPRPGGSSAATRTCSDTVAAPTSRSAEPPGWRDRRAGATLPRSANSRSRPTASLRRRRATYAATAGRGP
jgi:hypothetical protein